MLSGVKIIPRDQIKKDKSLDSVLSDGKRLSSSRKEKHSKKRSSRYSGSGSDDDDVIKIEKGSRKKWYSSDEYSSSSSDDSESSKRKYNKKKENKKKKSRRKEYSTEDHSSSDDTRNRDSHRDSGKADKKDHKRGRKNKAKKSKESGPESNVSGDEIEDRKTARMQMGLEWMLRPAENKDENPSTTVDNLHFEASKEETKKANPRELNPYFRDDGAGYPEEEVDGTKPVKDQLLPSSVVGDGGASWRMKALKRAHEQAAREGRKVDEIVSERWDSLGQLAVSVSAGAAAPSRAHLSAIRSRQRADLSVDSKNAVEDKTKNEGDTRKSSRDYLKDVSVRHSDMKKPKGNDSLSWGKRTRGAGGAHTRHSVSSSAEDANLIRSAISSLNKFSNDGSFMEEALRQQQPRKDSSLLNKVEELVPKVGKAEDDRDQLIEEEVKGLTVNQIAAKALQLRMKGKHDESQKLMAVVERLKTQQHNGEASQKMQGVQATSRHISRDISSQRRQEEDDGDMHLARNIMQNKKYDVARQADDEYDYDGAPKKKSRPKGNDNVNRQQPSAFGKRLLTQQERCMFCFENPSRPKHLVVSIANFTYLMLPNWQPLVPGHCCIVTTQHEASTRTVDTNVWDEIRNFKKCLIMMFSQQDKEVVFLETVINLAQQRRHCLVECIPIPGDLAKEAPLYFKKAIDEAEDEWSQHNAKKLIDTSVKGLRASIPKDFPYFHVEFGLNKGFVHVIDDEKQFQSSLGLNVIRGMLELPEEDMHRRRRSESGEVQRLAVASFARDWEPFDWTKQLD